MNAEDANPSPEVSPLRVALVGCGVIGRTHAQVITADPRFELTAVVDPIVGNRKDVIALVGEAHAPREFDSMTEALDSVDAVSITVPSGMHIQLALQALAHDKHVMIEKPLDVSLDRVSTMLDAAEAARHRGVVTTVVSQHRFDASSQIVARAIAHEGFGRITSAVASLAWWRSQRYYELGAWRGTWALDGGGALMNQGVHTLDLLLWYLGTPRMVFAQFGLLAHRDIEVEDTVVATISFESGALATVHATTATYPGIAASLQVMGDRGAARIDNDALIYFHSSAQRDEDAAMGFLGQLNTASDELAAEGAETVAYVDATVGSPAHAAQYRDFSEAIRTGREPLVTVAQAVRALATVRAIYLSATLQRPVNLDDVLSGAFENVDVHVPEVDAPRKSVEGGAE